eukprot:GEMP01003683.1.p1 GENE.GEMP01003683.1~~GEMP01003683.1.p1  ORF type:complete len:848 (+),score=185.00 GEMP01003683.1:1438-3981(+)
MDRAPVGKEQSNSVSLDIPVLHTDRTHRVDFIGNPPHVTYSSTSTLPVGSARTAPVGKRLMLPVDNSGVGEVKLLGKTSTLRSGEMRRDKETPEVVNIASPKRSLRAPLGQCPAARAYHRSCVIGDSLWVYGGTQDTSFGYVPFDDLYELNLNSRSPDYLLWVKHDFPGGPGPRCKHAMACYEKKIYLFGGWDGNRRCNDVFVFDTTANTWSKVEPPNGRATQANWPAPHTSHAQYIVGSIWVIVGRGETGTHRKYGCDIDFFDLTKHRWILGGARFNSRAGHTLSLMCDGKTICMVGGRKESPVEFFEVSKYAPNFGLNQRMQAECNSSAETTSESAWHVDNLLCRGPPYGRSFHGAANLTSTEGCSFPWFVCHGGFLEGNISTQRCLFDATAEIVIYDALHDAWYTPQNVELPPRGAHCLEMKLQTNIDGTKVAQLILFGGTHKGRVFNDLWIAELQVTDSDENVPRSNSNLGQKAKSFDPKAFQLELNSMTRIQKSEKSQQVKREIQMEKQRKNSLRDMRGIQMRLNLQKKERMTKCPDRVRTQILQKQVEAAKSKGAHSARNTDFSMPVSARSPRLDNRAMLTARSLRPIETSRTTKTDASCKQQSPASVRTAVAPSSAHKMHVFNPLIRRASSGAIMVSAPRSPRSSNVTLGTKGTGDRTGAANTTVKSTGAAPMAAAPAAKYWSMPICRASSNVALHTSRTSLLTAPPSSSACSGLTMPASTAIKKAVLGGGLHQTLRQQVVRQVGSLNNRMVFSGQAQPQPVRGGATMVGGTFARCLVSPRPHYRYLPMMLGGNCVQTTQLPDVAEQIQLQDEDNTGQDESLDVAAPLRKRSMVSLIDGL